MGKKLYLGTDSGLVVLEKANGQWSRAGAALEGKFVQKLELAEGGRLFAGVTGDGVYVADDPLGPWQRTLEADIRGLAVSPHDSDTIFAGTEPAGVFRSRDRGDTWMELTSVKELPSYSKWSFPAPPNIAHVRTFDFAPGEPHTVFAGVEVGGLIRSRDDGDTWEEFGEGIYEDVHYILSHPTDPNVMYSTTGEGFYRSRDGARTWEISQEGMPNDYTHPIILQPGNPDVLFIGSAAGAPPTFGGPKGAAAQIYRSRNGGESWQTLNGGLPETFHGMVRGLVVDPSNDAALYAGTTDGDLYYSEDEGDNWSLLMEGLPQVWVIKVPSG